MTILVTRPSPSGEQLVSSLQTLGLQAIHTPLISFTPGLQLQRLPAWLKALQPGDLVLAVSARAIEYAAKTLQKAAQPWPAGLCYAAIGHSTAQHLQDACGQPVLFPPAPETSEHFIALPALQHLEARRALILRGNGGRDVIAASLRARGITVTLCECYRRVPIAHPGSGLCADWQQRKVSTLVVTSGEMLQQLYDLVPEYDRRHWLLLCRLIVVSERLAQRARDLGWQDIRVATGADNPALLHTLQIN